MTAQAECRAAGQCGGAPMQWHPYVKGSVPTEQCLFWVVPKTAEEAPRSVDGNVVCADFSPHIIVGYDGTWSSLSKATHWMSLPAAPGQCGCEDEHE